MKRNILSVLTLVIVLFIAGWTLAKPSNLAPTQYEYKVTQIINTGLRATSTSKIETQLNDAGGQGWKLVSVTQDIFQGSSGATTTYYWRRAK